MFFSYQKWHGAAKKNHPRKDGWGQWVWSPLLPVSVICDARFLMFLRWKKQKCVHLLTNPDSSQIKNLGIYRCLVSIGSILRPWHLPTLRPSASSTSLRSKRQVVSTLSDVRWDLVFGSRCTAVVLGGSENWRNGSNNGWIEIQELWCWDTTMIHPQYMGRLGIQ